MFSMFVAALVLLPRTVASATDDIYGNHGSFRYDVAAERIFQGTIAGKAQTIEGLVYFPLQTKDSILQIQFGPKQFVRRSNFKLNPGASITVIGISVNMTGRDVILARQISNADGVMVLRDQHGVPLWDANRPVQMDSERQAKSGEICKVF